MMSGVNQFADEQIMLQSAIKFINNDCGMVHGNVRISSIFTNKAGEWKLGGFELLDSMKEESPMIMVSRVHEAI
jgi:hypothetical protein